LVKRPRRHTRPSTQPEQMSALVEPLFRWLKLDDAARGFRASRAFSRAAGPRIRAVARAEKLRGATLYVRVQTSAWSHELHALKAQLVEKLRKTPGGEGVEELRFNVEPLEELRRAVAEIADPELRAELSLLCAKLPRSRP
jgi:predicted nucleic acid-binding Zn ribbon protein